MPVPNECVAQVAVSILLLVEFAVDAVLGRRSKERHNTLVLEETELSVGLLHLAAIIDDARVVDQDLVGR